MLFNKTEEKDPQKYHLDQTPLDLDLVDKNLVKLF